MLFQPRGRVAVVVPVHDDVVEIIRCRLAISPSTEPVIVLSMEGAVEEVVRHLALRAFQAVAVVLVSTSHLAVFTCRAKRRPRPASLRPVKRHGANLPVAMAWQAWEDPTRRK